MSEKRRALGRGLGALIPNAPVPTGNSRPVDVFFPDQREPAGDPRDGASTAPADGAEEADQPTGAGGAAANGHGDAGSFGAPDSTIGDGTDTATGESGEADRSELAPVPGASFGDLPIDSIRPNPRQPRTVFDDDDMAELVHSIREIGVLQPVVVRPVSGDGVPDGIRYELIMGERRWRASQEAGRTTVPAIVKETDDDDLLRDALLENLHRSQLNALEEAAAYQQLLEDFGCTHDELASRIGRSRPQISNTLRLLRLPPLVARRVAAGVLSAGHARALLSLEDGAAMERLAQRIVAEGLSVRSVEEIVALGGDREKAAPRRPRPGGRHPQLDDLAARLSDRFDTRVAIALGQRKGKLTVEFASVEDLNRIVDLLGVDPRG
jgi:ParB family chromosome partitioning protein